VYHPFALAADADIERLIQAGVKSSKQLLANVRRDVAKAYMDGEIYTFPIDKLADHISRVMAFAELMGRRRSLLSVGLTYKEVGMYPLYLDWYSEIAKLIKSEGLDVELNRLEKKHARQIYDILRKAGPNINARIRYIISQTAAKGPPIRQGVTTILEAIDKLGITNINPSQVKTLYTTSITQAFAEGKWIQDHTPQVWSKFWGYEYVTMRDDRVRPNHRAWDGTVLPKNDPFWAKYWPPNGWNCRCQVIQIINKRATWQPRNPPQPDSGFEGVHSYKLISLSQEFSLSP